MKKLDKYIIRKFLGTFVLAMVLLLCIIVIFDVSEKLEKFIENKIPFKTVLVGYYFNFIPYFANYLAPFFTFISVILFTSKMAYNSEIIAILSTGISFKRFLFPYFIAATLIAVFSFFLGAFIIPNANEGTTEFQKEYMGKKYSNRETNIHLQIEPGVFIYMHRYDARNNIGFNFSFENFQGDSLVKKLTSSRIRWIEEEKKWRIEDWKLREIDGDTEIYTTGKQLDTLMGFYPQEFSEDPRRIKEQLTLPELNRYIEKLKLRGSANIIDFQIQKYKMWADAFATFILTLIGVSISSRKIRGGMGLHIGLGILMSFSYILFMQFSTLFATNGDMNPLLAVWIPNILFTIIALAVYRNAPK